MSTDDKAGPGEDPDAPGSEGLPSDDAAPTRRWDGGGADASEGDRSLGAPLSGIFGLDPQAAAIDPLLGREIGGVRIIRTIGQGGMGKVYEGEQVKPRRTVAVKVMRPGLATPEMRKRFEFEAEILARLRHPGIAQIFAAGVESITGVPIPYFIMEYIPGARTLTRHAEESRLSTRARLDLFRSVCEAVAHGHQKGVVHRDLKPGNILVDATGQPKVIDFGVAKATDSDLALTTMRTDVGQLVGTLQYMGPEQFDGDPDEIDIRCDVYALGVVLYQLLTGKLPYDVRQKAVLEVMRIVKEEEPTPISALDKTLRRDVAVIAGKCLEKDRARRYSSAAELGADVARYLAGEPIQASPPSFVDGLARLARRHRAAAAATAGILLSLMVAVAGIAVFYTRWRAQREIADQATREAEKLEDFITYDFPTILKPTASLDVIDRVLRTFDGPGAAHTPERTGVLALIRGDLAQAMGKLEEARAHFERARTIMETLVEGNPHNAEWRRNLAASHCRLGDLAMTVHDIERAQEHLDAAFPITRALAAGDPSNADWQRNLAVCHAKLADVALTVGDYGRAREHLEQTRSIMAGLVAENPRAGTWQRELAVSLRGLGDVMQKEGDLDGARGHFETACDIVRHLTASGPNNNEWQKDLAVSLGRLGDLALEMRQVERARVHHDEALGIWATLTLRDPHNTQWRRDMAVCHGQLGMLARGRGDADDARANLTKAVEIQQELVQQDSLNASWRKDLAVSLSRLGELEMELETPDRTRARALFEKVLEITESFAQEDSRDVEWQDGLAVSHFWLGSLDHDEDAPGRAKDHFEQAVRIMQRLAAKDPGNMHCQESLAAPCVRLGRLARDRREWVEARDWFVKAVEAADRVLERSSTADMQYLLARTLEALVECHLRLGDAAAAEECTKRLRDLRVPSDRAS